MPELNLRIFSRNPLVFNLSHSLGLITNRLTSRMNQAHLS